MEEKKIASSETQEEVVNEPDIAKLYLSFDTKCTEIVATTLDDVDRQALQGTSHTFFSELAIWIDLVGNNRSVPLLKSAAIEYQFCLLAVVQGQYRNAFKGLRLTLELILQSILLSANEMELREWQMGNRDTSWARILGKEDGIFSQRFCAAFSPLLSDEIEHFRSMAKLTYRDLSQFVHGNENPKSPLPNLLEFHNDYFETFHCKADLVAYVCSFSLMLRYSDELKDESFHKIDSHLSARIGNLQCTRDLLAMIRGA